MTTSTRPLRRGDRVQVYFMAIATALAFMVIAAHSLPHWHCGGTRPATLSPSQWHAAIAAICRGH